MSYYSEVYYPRNRAKMIARTLKRIRANKAIMDERKSVPCADCGQRYPPHVMDFDHLRDKVNDVSKMHSWSTGTLLREIDKCEVVCSNCHRKRTHERVTSSSSAALD